MKSYNLSIPFGQLLAVLALFLYVPWRKRQKRQIRHCASYLAWSRPAAPRLMMVYSM